MFKGLANFGSLIQQAQEIGGKMQGSDPRDPRESLDWGFVPFDSGNARRGVFRQELDDGTREGAWFTNGDVGYKDEDGYLFLCDRRKDMIISGGVNIFPSEIEAVICDHPRVRDCAVFGIPDDEFGETIAAAVEADGDLAEADIRSLVSDRLAG